MTDQPALDFAVYDPGRSRAVSDATYREIVSSGLIGHRQRQFLDALMLRDTAKGVTCTELAETVRLPGIWKRASELARMGVIYAVCERPCRVTGRMVQAWRLTGELPRGQREPTLKERRTSTAEWLEQQIKGRESLILSRTTVYRLVSLLRGQRE